MRQHHPSRSVILLAVLLVLGACTSTPTTPSEPTAVLRLIKTDYSNLAGWGGNNPAPALAAFRQSCAVLTAKPDTESLGGTGYAGTVADWRSACDAADKADPNKAQAFFEQWFTPVAIAAGEDRQGRFTGYYEPEIFASRTRHGAYQTPVYGKPDDLISVDLGTFRPALKGERIAGRVENGKLVPYPDRGDIAANGLAHAPVLFYTDDPIDLFFLHIQGSGRVAFEDGSHGRVVYAAQNGQPYTAIGKILIERGVPKEGMSLQVIRAWLRAHPAEAAGVMNSDASFVFFKEDAIGDVTLGAKGAQGVALTPRASLAVDLRLHGLGTPFFVEGPAPLGRLLIAQDTGGAIRGAVRGDIYFGYGPTAEAEAGSQNQLGSLFALLPKALVQRLGESGMLQ